MTDPFDKKWNPISPAGLDEKVLLAPLRWRKPRKIFVCSMTDLFGEWVPDDMLDRIIAVMALCPQHTFQVLTKRPKRMREYCSSELTPFRIARSIDALRASGNRGDEEILPIDGYPGYFASSHGVIYSDRRGQRRALRPDVGDQGHCRVQLHRDGSGIRGDRLLVHRIILETFEGPPPAPDIQGRHRDGNPKNNALANLQWGDQSSNWSDSKRHGNHRRYSKLTVEQVAEIRRRHSGGDTGEALAREFSVSATQIRNIASGRRWNVEAPIEWPLPNVWKGVTAENQPAADERIPQLLTTPAAVRWVSYEPALGPLDAGQWLEPAEEHGVDLSRSPGSKVGGCVGVHPALDWIVCGGESGHHARPMHPDWARSIRAQCKEAGVAFFMKQICERGRPLPMDRWPDDLRIREFPEVK